MPSTTPAIEAAQRTASYIYWPGAPDPWWAVNVPSASYVILPQPAPEPRRPPDAQAALLAAGDYLDASLEALDAGDVATLLHNLCVLQSIAGVIADRFSRSSSEYVDNARALQ
jgi:hypothetical protein